MSNKLNWPGLIIFFVSFAGIVACDDLLEKDITDKKIILTAPGNNTMLKKFDVTFWWDDVGGVREFEIQVVSPSFTSIEYLVIDSIISTNKLTSTMEPGQYEWRVKGLNGAYETSFSNIGTFSVDSAADFKLQTVLLTAPKDGSYRNDRTVQFSWQALPLADSFLVQVRNNSFDYDTILTGSTVIIKIPESSFAYEWNVTGMNSDGQSKISDTWKLWVDLTSPEIPVLQTPHDDSVFIDFPVTLRWQSDDSDRAEDLLYLSKNMDGTEIVDGFPKKMIETRFTFDAADPSPLLEGTYYWTVQSIDKAGNESIKAEPWQFTLNEN